MDACHYLVPEASGASQHILREQYSSSLQTSTVSRWESGRKPWSSCPFYLESHAKQNELGYRTRTRTRSDRGSRQQDSEQLHRHPTRREVG